LGVERSRALLVGDSAVDVRTARNAGIRVCGVSYGFQPETFAEDPPDMMVDRPEELARAVIAERHNRGASNS
jgi:phosphoglycolate phosphatase